MPKPKPDQVIRHEIVLSRPLQDTVDGLVGSMQFSNIATPAVDLMKDVSGMAVFLSLVASLGLTGVGFTLILTGQEDTAESVINSALLFVLGPSAPTKLKVAGKEVPVVKLAPVILLATCALLVEKPGAIPLVA
jgi:hypothetical protein